LFNLGVFLMKKTLIAMAVLAASGASFAQVSITGSLGFGYRATSSATNAIASGFGVSDSGITFAATEDLGGGLTAKAQLGIDSTTRAGVNGADTALSLAGSFGTVKFTSGNGSDYLSEGVSGVGSPAQAGFVMDVLKASDGLSFALPAFGPFTVSVSHSERSTATPTVAGSSFGIGAGAAGVTGQRQNGAAVAYAAGPLAGNVSLTSYDQTETTGANSKLRTRAAVAYDLGVAKLGAGYEGVANVEGTTTSLLLAASVPVGNLTLSGNVGSRAIEGRTTTTSDNKTYSGYALGAAYALSKRTSVNGTYIQYAVTGTANPASETTIKLLHAF
jgi:predicted porin